ncbi:hypothetical protein Trydic_g16578 [Trypoxylus dichotomus]
MNNKYEIVETILRAAGDDEDLKIIGVDTVTRTNILKNCSNFQMRLETRSNLVFSKEYIQTVLNQIANHLHLHHANLACAVLREDTIICDVKLLQASRALLYHIQQLENEVHLIEKGFHPKIVSRKMTKIILMTIVGVALIGYLNPTQIRCSNWFSSIRSSEEDQQKEEDVVEEDINALLGIDPHEGERHALGKQKKTLY